MADFYTLPGGVAMLPEQYQRFYAVYVPAQARLVNPDDLPPVATPALPPVFVEATQ